MICQIEIPETNKRENSVGVFSLMNPMMFWDKKEPSVAFVEILTFFLVGF